MQSEPFSRISNVNLRLLSERHALHEKAFFRFVVVPPQNPGITIDTCYSLLCFARSAKTLKFQPKALSHQGYGAKPSDTEL
jgi:hypothetical protein